MCEHCSFFTRTQEPYNFLLERREWGAKRMRILARDKYTCRKCGIREGEGVALQVHHIHYIFGLDPWEYRDSELITLCENCHQEVHSQNEVPVYRLDGENLIKIDFTPCYRCNGAGWFPEYKHVQGGVCFRCHGAKYDDLIEVVENYAQEHDINIKDIDDGFLAINPNVKNVGTIVNAYVRQSYYTNRPFVQLVFNNGQIRSCCLDFSVDANPGDKLDPNKLRYRMASKKNGEQYILIKGTRL